MTRTGRPSGIDEFVVQRLLDVLHDLRLPARDVELLYACRALVDEPEVYVAHRASDVALESGDELSQVELR